MEVSIHHLLYLYDIIVFYFIVFFIESGVYLLFAKFPDNYPYKPPEIRFVTPVRHPCCLLTNFCFIIL